MKSLIQPLLSAALLFELTPAVESRINWGGDWDGVTDWSEIPEGVFVGPGVGYASGGDFCNVVRNKSQPLKLALSGRNLSLAVQYGPGFDFFVYNPEEKLSSKNPTGMIAGILDELAARAGFSWRNTFVAYNTTSADILVGKGSGKWDRMLKQTTTLFDVSVDKWFLTAERLENETVFLNSWFDSSLILVDQAGKAKINWLGFATPFENQVWVAIAITVLMSAIFMLIIESLEDRRDGRTVKSWFSDHLYLTTLAFSQQFLFMNPSSAAGRVFLSSFAFWAMLIGATYTANLASQLVEDALTSPVNSVESAMAAKLSICIHEGSASQTIVETIYPRLRDYKHLVSASNPRDMYDLLLSGGCEILIGTKQEFAIFGNEKKYGCNLVQAGSEIHSGTASFAIEFNPLNCDSVLAYVLNLHFYEMNLEGLLDDFWDAYLNNKDDTCEYKSGRRLTEAEEDDSEVSRKLKAAAGVTASDPSQRSDTTSLNLVGMAGVFVVHAAGTAIAILIAIYSHLRKYRKHKQKRQKEIFGVDTVGAAKSELEQKYDELKADMMAKMDRFFEENRESAGSNWHSERRMRSIIVNPRLSMIHGLHHGRSSPKPPRSKGGVFLDMSDSGRSSPNHLTASVLKSGISDSLRLDPSDESGLIENDGTEVSPKRVRY